MKTETEIKNKIEEINDSDLSKPFTKESYKLHLTSLLEWVIK